MNGQLGRKFSSFFVAKRRHSPAMTYVSRLDREKLSYQSDSPRLMQRFPYIAFSGRADPAEPAVSTCGDPQITHPHQVEQQQGYFGFDQSLRYLGALLKPCIGFFQPRELLIEGTREVATRLSCSQTSFTIIGQVTTPI